MPSPSRDNVYHEPSHIAQLQSTTRRMPNPHLRHDREPIGPEKSAEDIIREEIRAFQESEANPRRAGGSTLARAKMRKDHEMFHHNLDFTPQARVDQTCPLRIISERDIREEGKGKGLKTFLERHAAKMKVDREANMRLHANLNDIYTGVSSAEENMQADEKLRAHDRWGLASILGGDIDTHEEEASMPQMERFEVTRPPLNRGTPCNRVKSCNHIWPDCMNSGFFGSKGFSIEFAGKDEGRQTKMANGNGNGNGMMGEDVANGMKKQMVEELMENNKEVDNESRGLKREVMEAEEEEEAKKDELSEKVKESLRPEKLGAQYEDEEEDTDEARIEGAEEYIRGYIRVAQSNIPMGCDGYQRTNEPSSLSDHQSQQTPYPHNPKSKWIIVNDFVEDREEFVFVENNAYNRG